MRERALRRPASLGFAGILVLAVASIAPGPRGESARADGPSPPAAPAEAVPATPDPAFLARMVQDARLRGDARRGAALFVTPTLACVHCHQVGAVGGAVGPALTSVAAEQAPETIVASLFWPQHEVKEGYQATVVALATGEVVQGYRRSGDDDGPLVLYDPVAGRELRLDGDDIEERREVGSLMPEGLAQALTPQQRRDLVRFLLDLGTTPAPPVLPAIPAHGHGPVAFPHDRAPLDPATRPSRQAPVNRDRDYDFYAKEGLYYRDQPVVPTLLPEFPGLDGGQYGHWGNQNEDVWADDRWNATDLGRVLSGVFRAGDLTVPKGVCVRLGDRGEPAVCFNPLTLRYEAAWTGGFVEFSTVRHGFLDGLRPVGTLLPTPEATPLPDGPRRYLGVYRHGDRVLFAYRVGDIDYLDAPWVDDAGRFERVVAPADEHPYRSWTRGGPTRRPQVIETAVRRGVGDGPYVIDTFEPPFENPWKALLFFGGHDFLPDGSAVLCTMQGDVWRVEGLDGEIGDGDRVRWRRIASGLHQALGLRVVEGRIHVLGRDQITRLHDLNGDGEIDFYECVSHAFETSTAGHDFICGLEVDAQGRFLTASGNQGLIRVDPDGATVEVLATGFRNPDGLGLAPDGSLTVPSSEGDWVPASMVCEVRAGGHYGYPGPRDGRPPDLPLLYLPRGLDNSSGGQAFAPADDPRWGPLAGALVHTSFGAGSWFAVLRDRVDGRPQGLALPMPGEFRSGAHRARFRPHDGQLYVSGMAGWGSYTTDDGSFQRVRYTGAAAHLPVGWRAHANGIVLRFPRPIDAGVAANPRAHFVQAWNYRYGPGYGSPEYAPTHPGARGHDALAIASAHVVEDGRGLFLELPDLQPVNQIHLMVQVDAGRPLELVGTVHRLAEDYSGFPGYAAVEKTIAAHPILADLAALSAKPRPNPWRSSVPEARPLAIEAGKNLSYSTTTLHARAGEWVRLTFVNPDVVPHNWVLARPGTLSKVGELANQLVGDPEAALRHYVPESPDVLAYTDLVEPNGRETITFQVPEEPGRYPYLCTFPGHWMVMNGRLVVEPAADSAVP